MYIAQIILLLLIVIAVGVSVWLWFTGFAVQSANTPPILRGGLKVEAVSTLNSNLYIYVRNVGYVPLTLDKVYVWDSRGNLVAVYNATTLSLLVWGGDVWNVSGTVRLVERGLILYDDFDGNSLNTNLWEVRANEYARETRLSVGNSYLKVAVASKERGKWATYGVFTRSPISLPDSYVFEVELWKKGRAYWYYAVCLYIMSTNVNDNPYYNTPWFAAKLYPRGRSTVAQLAYRDDNQTRFRNLWFWRGNEEPHVHMVVIVGRGYAARVLLWDSSRTSSPNLDTTLSFQALWGNVYLALTVDNPTTFLDEGWFGYVKIYKNTSFTLTGLKPGAKYKLAGSKGECTITVNTTVLTVDPLNPPTGCEWLQEEYFEHGYPMKIKIDSKVFGRIEPQELKTVVLEVNLPPGTYTLKITTREGISTTTKVFIGKS